MELFVDDAGFVRAPAWLTYRRLANVAAWPAWWRGTRVRAMPAGADGATWAVELAGARLRRLRLAIRLHDWRHDVGFALQVTGNVAGRAEFWLEDAYGGTVVHHVLAGCSAGDQPRGRGILEDYRRAIRRGLWGLKDALQIEARTSAGLDP